MRNVGLLFLVLTNLSAASYGEQAHMHTDGYGTFSDSDLDSSIPHLDLRYPENYARMSAADRAAWHKSVKPEKEAHREKVLKMHDIYIPYKEQKDLLVAFDYLQEVRLSRDDHQLKIVFPDVRGNKVWERVLPDNWVHHYLFRDVTQYASPFVTYRAKPEAKESDLVRFYRISDDDPKRDAKLVGTAKEFRVKFAKNVSFLAVGEQSYEADVMSFPRVTELEAEVEGDQQRFEILRDFSWITGYVPVRFREIASRVKVTGAKDRYYSEGKVKGREFRIPEEKAQK